MWRVITAVQHALSVHNVRLAMAHSNECSIPLTNIASATRVTMTMVSNRPVWSATILARVAPTPRHVCPATQLSSELPRAACVLVLMATTTPNCPNSSVWLANTPAKHAQ